MSRQQWAVSGSILHRDVVFPVSRADACMRSPASPTAGFFSAPFEPEEVARLSALVEARRLARGEPPFDALPVALVELGRLLAVPDAPGAGGVPAVPRFDVARGSLVARVLKRAANAVLAPFARPQRHFHAAIRATLAQQAEALAALRAEHARTSAAIERLDDRAGRLERPE